MIENNTVIIDLAKYDRIKNELYDYKRRVVGADKTNTELTLENRKLKVEILTDWLKRNFVKVTKNGNGFEWEYTYKKNEYYAFAFNLNASLEVAEIALNEYIESKKGEE